MYTWQPGMTLESIERDAILAAFRHFRGNKLQTSQALGISVRTLEYRLEAYQKEKDERDKAAADREQADREFNARARGRHLNATPTRGSEASYEPTFPSAPPAGMGMEPPAEISAQQPMPLQIGQEVQSMSPPKHAAGNNKRGRR